MIIIGLCGKSESKKADLSIMEYSGIESFWQMGIFSMQRFSWGNRQASHKHRFGFCGSSLFLYATMAFTTMLLRPFAHAQKQETNLQISHT